MEKTAISTYKALVAQYGTPIPDEEFKELRGYAKDHSIKLTGFKDYVGDIQTIKIVIDDICEIAKDFPLIIDKKTGICLELDYGLKTAFATTEHDHIIHLNAVYFADLSILEKEYNEGVDEGRFVKGTNWRAIARHEVGHVVESIYRIGSMQIAMDIIKTDERASVIDYVRRNLSRYSAEYIDGREIISESFSGYYSKTDNIFANKFLKRILGEEGQVM